MGIRTLKQIEASRINGAKSRGPVAAKANYAAIVNSVRYGLLAGTVVLPGESNDRFLEMVHTMAAHLKPANEIEACLIDTLAISRWCQLRFAGLLKSATELEMARQEGPAPNRAIEALKDHDGSLAALRRDETIYGRQFDRALRLLLKMKDKQIRPSSNPIAELSSAGATFEPISAPEPEETTPQEE